MQEQLQTEYFKNFTLTEFRNLCNTNNISFIKNCGRNHLIGLITEHIDALDSIDSFQFSNY